jgi:superfamily II DNA or RNA helicase
VRDGDGRPHPEEAAAYAEHRETYRDFVYSEGIRMAAPDGWARFLSLARSPRGAARFSPTAAEADPLASQGKLEVLEGLLRQHAKDRTLIFTNDNDTVYAIARPSSSLRSRTRPT